MAFIYNLLDTWNNAGTVFSGIKLNVTDTNSAAGSKLLDLQIGGSSSFNVDKTGQAFLSAGTALLPSLSTMGDANTGMWFPAADTIAWSTGGSERLRIDSSGMVGFGTSAPNSRIEAVATTADIYARSNSSTGYADIGAVRSDFYSGPSYASTTLRQFGASRTGTSFGLSNAGLGLIVFQNTTNAVIGTNGTTPLIFATLSVERVRINSSGNVGIGTTAPDALLSVNGIASFGAGAVTTPSVAAFGDLNTGMWFPAADTIAWSTNGSERLRITSGGNLGLGTSTFGTSAATVFSIATGTAPTTGVADTIQIYSTDLSAGNTMLSLYTEGTVVNANTTAAATHRIAIRVNGTVYYLLANTAA